jgi:hypothetical protein
MCNRVACKRVVELLESRRLLATSVIDLAVVYTAGAVTELGDDAKLRSRVQQSIDAMNFAMNNSRIDITVRVVRMEPISYTGSNDLYVDRTRLGNPADGFLDSAHAVRNAFGADLVMLVVENSNGGGNADLMTNLAAANNSTLAFSAIAANSLGANNFTVAHELGHNLGAGHERDNPFQPAVGPFSYSVGYRFTAEGRTYHDIMSYDPGIGIAYYANPTVSYLGSPTGAPIGSANEADIASTFAQTGPVVANYRSTVVADTSAPLAQVDAVRIKDGFAHVSMLYLDDGGINQTTIGTGDITLDIPGLPTLTPVLDSIENAAIGGAFKRATYRAYLRDARVDPKTISVSVVANQIRNLANLAASSGIAGRSTTHSAGWSYADARGLGELDSDLLVNGQLTEGDSDQVFRFTLTSARTVSLRMTNLLANGNLFLARDANGDGLYQFDEYIEGGFGVGGADATLTLNLGAGEYFAWTYLTTPTPYTLMLRAYSDTVAPTATLDARDISALTTEFLFNVIYRDDQELNAVTTRYYSPVRLTNPFGGYYVYFAEAIDIDSNGPMRIVTYRINAGFTLGAADNGIYTVAMEPANSPVFSTPLDRYVSDGAGNRLPAVGTLGTFRVAIGQADSTAPSAVDVQAPTIQRGGASSYEFEVTYTDNRALDAASLATAKVRVTGPAGFDALAEPISVSDPQANSARRTVRYRVAAPGGIWDYPDRGTYTLLTVANQIKDASNNSATVATIGSFVAIIPIPGDSNRDGLVDFDDLLTIAQNYGQTGRTFAQGNFDDDEAGHVNFDDLLALAQHYGQSNVSIATPKKRRTRAADVGLV